VVIARNGLQRITLEVTVIEAENLGPLIVKQKSVAGIEEILLFYEEVSTREFQDHLQRLNGIEVSPTVISNVTNKIMPLIKEWQNRPLPNSMPLFLWMPFISMSARTARLQKRPLICP